jgi:hypothetical protein
MGCGRVLDPPRAFVADAFNSTPLLSRAESRVATRHERWLAISTGGMNGNGNGSDRISTSASACNEECRAWIKPNVRARRGNVSRYCYRVVLPRYLFAILVLSPFIHAVEWS